MSVDLDLPGRSAWAWTPERSLDALGQLAAEVMAGLDRRGPWLEGLRDAHEPYYRFLHELVLRLHPLTILEIGTYVGVSAAHMAYDNHGGRVVTVDINPDAKRWADLLRLPNLLALTSNSSQAVPLVEGYGPFDVLYIDGLHNFNQTYGEYVLYRPLVREGGLIIFDDVALPMATNEMEVFWRFVTDPKLRVDALHHTGFGVAIKTGAPPPPWEAVIGEACSLMR